MSIISTMTTPEYGTPEYYEQMFADILSDAGCGDRLRDSESAKNIMECFEKANNDNAT